MSRRRHALITGGAGGIGLGIAQTMLDAGYTVTATGVSDAEVSAVPPKPHLTVCRLDVTSDASVSALMGSVADLHALVNCAGIIGRADEYGIDVFRQVIEVNLTGSMRMCLAAKKKLAASGGAIVNTASMLSFFGGPHAPAYSASKGGVVQLTKSLAAAWADEGIRVNAIAPGWITTELTKTLQDDPARSAAILARTPMARWGEPGDIGGAVVFLCSDAARFITGAVLPVDGGYAVV